MKGAFRSALLITIFTFSAQLLLFVTQMMAASYFGAGVEMDAYLASSTMPQYITSVLLGSLGFVFIPLFIEQKSAGDEKRAYLLGIYVFNNVIALLAIVTIAALLFNRQLLQFISPGLDASAVEIGVVVAEIAWPSVVFTGAFTLLAAVHQAEKNYRWQALAPLIGAGVNLVLLAALAPYLDVVSLAIATSASILVQTLLLIGIINRHHNYTFSLGWNDKNLHQLLRIMIPLVLVAIVTKFTPIIDRYLASDLPTGSISHLNYAFRIVTIISALASVGGATVIFPKMASDATLLNRDSLRETTTLGLNMMWLIIAPVITIGFSLSMPVIVFLLERGNFVHEDSVAVSDILKIYLPALIAMSLGNITSRGFYVLKDTKTLAIFGTLEAAAYCVYTVYLTRWLGVPGIAIGYLIYFLVSLSWQLIILGKKMRSSDPGARKNSLSFLKTAFAALAAGIFAHVIVVLAPSVILQLVLGGGGGLLIYLGVLLLLKSEEIKLLNQFRP